MDTCVGHISSKNGLRLFFHDLHKSKLIEPALIEYTYSVGGLFIIGTCVQLQRNGLAAGMNAHFAFFGMYLYIP